MKKFLFSLICFLLLFSTNAVASHEPFSWESFYTYLGNNKYLVESVYVRRCGSPPSAMNVLVTDGTNNIILNNQVLIKSVDLSGVSPGCPQQSACFGGTYVNSYIAYHYRDTLDLSGYSSCNWRIILYGLEYNSTITTGMGGEFIYTYAELNHCQNNSSAKFETYPEQFICWNQNTEINLKVTDTKNPNDFFSYQLVPALTTGNQQASYIGGHSPIRPLQFFGWPNPNIPYPAGFHLDTNTGLLTFRPVQKNQIAVVAVEVKEWRMVGAVQTLVGTRRRFMTLHVYECSNSIINNTRPVFSQLDDTINFCVKDSFCYPISTYDADGDSTILEWEENGTNGNLNISYANNQFAQGTICWKPGNIDVSDTPYFVKVRVRDNKCPTYKFTDKFIFIKVRDSVDGPSVDIGPDILDSTGLDSFQVRAALSDYSGQKIQWSTGGDGFFLKDDDSITWYYPGLDDKLTCGYSLYCEITDPTPCMGNSKLIDTLNVTMELSGFSAGTDQSITALDTIQLQGSGNANRAWTYQWRLKGDSKLSDSSDLNAQVIPGMQDLFKCSWMMYLQASGCDTLLDSIQITRTFIPVNGGMDYHQPIADSIQLNGPVLSGVNSYWRSEGLGILKDSLGNAPIYYPVEYDYNACRVLMIREEYPGASCYVNADTVQLDIYFSGMDAGSDQSINLMDSTHLLASPNRPSGVNGYWTSSGKGTFSDSFDRNAVYFPDTSDYQNCSTRLFWNYPYPACSSEKDSLLLGFNYPDAVAGPDVQVNYGDTISLAGQTNQTNISASYWLTAGTGVFVHPNQPINKYIPGIEDWEACGGSLVLVPPYLNCGAKPDTLYYSVVRQNLSAGADFSVPLGSNIPLQASTDAKAVRWRSTGIGAFDDSLQKSTAYTPDSLDYPLCTLTFVIEETEAACGLQKDSIQVSWIEEKAELGDFTHAPCFDDTLYFSIRNPSNYTVKLLHGGTGISDYDSIKGWYYIRGKEEENGTDVVLILETQGYCSLLYDSVSYRLPDLSVGYGNGKIYPNPSRDEVTLEVGGCPVRVQKVELYDSRGRRVNYWEIDDLPFVFSMQGLANGVYAVRMTLENGQVQTYKVTKY